MGNDINIFEKRKYQRVTPIDTSALKTSIRYMEEEINCTLQDISLGGVGISTPRMPYSLINNSIIVIRINSKYINIEIQARVVYSFKEPQNPDSRKYGIEFTIPNNNDIKEFINLHC